MSKKKFYAVNYCNELVALEDGIHRTIVTPQQACDLLTKQSSEIARLRNALDTAERRLKVLTDRMSIQSPKMDGQHRWKFHAYPRNSSNQQRTARAGNRGAIMTPETFGAIGDGVVDDTQALKEVAKHTSETGELFTDSGGRIYKTSEPITFYDKANVDLFDSAIRGEVVVSKKEPGTMRLRVKAGGIKVKRLPKASNAHLRAEGCDIGILLAGDVEACKLNLEAAFCEYSVSVTSGLNEQTLDECDVHIFSYDVCKVLHIQSGGRQITGRFDVFAEQVMSDAIDICGRCRVTLSGQLRAICKTQGTSGLRALEDSESSGRPHIMLENLSMIGSRVPNTQPFKTDGVREFGGTFQATNF